MKEIMEKINKVSLALLLCGAVLFFSCEDEYQAVDYESGASLAVANPYIAVTTPVVSFQAGTATYDIAVDVINGANSVTTLNVYSVYTEAGTGLSSELTLFDTEVITAATKQVYERSVTYEDLKSGVTVNGSALPDSDVDLPVGSGWVLTFEGVLADGSTVALPGTINIAVLSRFAGLYETIETDYWRINVQSGGADWTGQERFIGSVDENTFSYNDYWGLFSASGFFVFDLNEDNSITVIDDPSQLFFTGTYMLTCQEDGDMFNNVPCDGSNVLIPDDVTGEHIIKLTYGYFTETGDENEGPREFYEVLKKVVD